MASSSSRCQINLVWCTIYTEMENTEVAVSEKKYFSKKKSRIT